MDGRASVRFERDGRASIQLERWEGFGTVREMGGLRYS